jgi:hypothetical protein
MTTLNDQQAKMTDNQVTLIGAQRQLVMQQLHLHIHMHTDTT